MTTEQAKVSQSKTRKAQLSGDEPKPKKQKPDAEKAKNNDVLPEVEKVQKDGQPKKSRTEVRKEQHDVAKERRMNRPHADVIEALRPYWEVIRQKHVKKEEKVEPITRAVELIQGHVADLAKKGDSSRMLQSIFSYASTEQRVLMAQEFSCPDRELNNDHTLHFLKKMVGDCPKSREVIIKGMRGNILRFFKTRLQCSFLEEVFLNLNATMKMQLLAEVYSTEYATLSIPLDLITVPALIAKFPGKRDIVLTNLRALAPQLLSKKLLDFTVVQRLVNEYFALEVPSKLTEAVESYIEHVEVMLQTNLGVSAVVRLIAAATAKDRKQLVKTLKSHVRDIVFSPAAAVILMALMEFTDDTVLVGKAIVQEMLPYLEEIVKDKVGSRVVLFLLAGRTNKNITGQYVGMLDECDQLAAATSKKDPIIRRNELLQYILPSLQELLESQPLWLIKSQFAFSVVIEYLNVKDETVCSTFLTRIIQESGSISQLMQDRTAEQFIRAFIKRSESFGRLVYNNMSADLTTHLQNDSGFLFAVMLRYAVVKEMLEKRLKEIEAVDSKAATFLVAKIKSWKAGQIEQ
jgi:pumilio family protein 6